MFPYATNAAGSHTSPQFDFSPQSSQTIYALPQQTSLRVGGTGVPGVPVMIVNQPPPVQLGQPIFSQRAVYTGAPAIAAAGGGGANAAVYFMTAPLHQQQQLTAPVMPQAQQQYYVIVPPTTTTTTLGQAMPAFSSAPPPPYGSFLQSMVPHTSSVTSVGALPPGQATNSSSVTSAPLLFVPTMDASPKSASASASLTQTTAGASGSSRPLPDVSMWGYAVVDQYHPSLQRLPVAPSVVSRSRGTLMYNNDVQSSSTKPCASTVCLRFTSRSAPAAESCPLEEQCPAFHVERSYLEGARKVTEPLCCALHNDYFSQEMLASNCAPQITTQRFTLVLEDRSEVELLPVQLALTVGLDQLTQRGNTKVIHLRKQVCRLHVEGKCKWTKDCGHVHLCRELHRFLLSFHFPSLWFLFMTEGNGQVICARIASEPQLVAFVRSACVLPVITQLLEANRTIAVEALLAAGAVPTVEQVASMKAAGVNLPPTCVPRAPVSEKIAHLLVPRSTERCPNSNTSEDLVAVQVAEHALSTPTKPESKSLTMPSFSPSTSVTSMDRPHRDATTTPPKGGM